jgi:hypothetical protein
MVDVGMGERESVSWQAQGYVFSTLDKCHTLVICLVITTGNYYYKRIIPKTAYLIYLI